MPLHPSCPIPIPVRGTTCAALAAAYSLAGLLALGAAPAGAGVGAVEINAAPLRISAFRDICAFILETIGNRGGPGLDITYVKNADAAHADLMQRRADIVFMSYDDTLSVALQDRYPDIAAFLPVHGGILDLCGRLDRTGPTRVGIDTDSGYARALRRFLRERLGEPRYAQLTWVKAGATDLRAERLQAGDIDATLLNPPFSLRPGVSRIATLAGDDTTSRYQGVVANLNRTAHFDTSALAGTERIFAQDTGIAVPATRTWLMDPPPGGSHHNVIQTATGPTTAATASGRATLAPSRPLLMVVAMPALTSELVAAAMTMPVTTVCRSSPVRLIPARDRVMASTSTMPEAAANARTPTLPSQTSTPLARTMTGIGPGEDGPLAGARFLDREVADEGYRGDQDDHPPDTIRVD